MKSLSASAATAALILAKGSGVQGDCLIEGDMMYPTGAFLRSVGFQCITDTKYVGDEEICGEDGQITRTKGQSYDCPQGTHCEMCGPPRRGAAMCVADGSSLEAQGIGCNFPSNYKTDGCFTFEKNNTIVPPGTVIGEATTIGCSDQGDIEEAYIICGDNWFHDYLTESRSCPNERPICKFDGDSAYCVADESKKIITMTTSTGTNTGSGSAYEIEDLTPPDGCAVSNAFYEVGEIVKVVKWECTSDSEFNALEHQCLTGGGVVGNTISGTCPQGIKSFCHQCGDPSPGAAVCSNSATPPENCMTGSEHVARKNAAGITTASVDKDASGSGSSNAAQTVKCLDEDGNAYNPGEPMAIIGFECTGNSLFEGKRITCGEDGNPSKDSSIVALSCDSATPDCYQCGTRSPGAAICVAGSPTQAQARSFASECVLVGAAMPTQTKPNAAENASSATTQKMSALLASIAAIAAVAVTMEVM